jgi:acetyltransferase-like isoleucine patch superfamily enzyme
VADILVFGAGQIADVARVYIGAHGPDRIVGFTVDAAHKTANTFSGLPLVEWEDLERHYPPGSVKLIGPLSYRRLNEFRRDRHLDGKRRGYTFTSFVHPGCFSYTTDIGENCFILEGNVLQPFSKIGTGVMMWSSNHIGHHATVGDYCFLASQVAVGGSARIGERTFMAGRVGVESGVTVGSGCFLDTAVVIKRDLPDESVVRGPVFEKCKYPASRMKRFV